MTPLYGSFKKIISASIKLSFSLWEPAIQAIYPAEFSRCSMELFILDLPAI